MVALWYRPVQFLMLTALSWLQVSALSSFYSTLVLQTLALHRSTLLSLALCFMGIVLTPSFAPSLLSFWLFSLASRKSLYVHYDNPLPLLLSILGSYLAIGLVLHPLSPTRIFCQTTCAFLLHVNGGLAWAARHETMTLMSAKPYRILRGIGALSLALCLPLPYVLLGLFILMGFSMTTRLIFFRGEEQWLLTFFSLSLLTRTPREQILLSIALIMYSLLTAYKGLHYDSQYTPPAIQRPDSRAKRHYCTLPFSKKLSSFGV